MNKHARGRLAKLVLVLATAVAVLPALGSAAGAETGSATPVAVKTPDIEYPMCCNTWP
ncbi:hypothetical protein [Nonomuraea phyllanthi]|uniref:hypothetical protein n=1 Tax=Nonomuraea phyllanthi TaxID=2219224 RepID=UPI001293C6C5|nr:hypothetical protein [Nonomuraea phyllanthi]